MPGGNGTAALEASFGQFEASLAPISPFSTTDVQPTGTDNDNFNDGLETPGLFSNNAVPAGSTSKTDSGPLTSAGSDAVDAPSTVAQAREGAAVIGGETMYEEQNSAARGGGETAGTGLIGIVVPEVPVVGEGSDWLGNKPIYRIDNRVDQFYGIYLQGVAFYQPINISKYNYEHYTWISNVTVHPNRRANSGRILLNPFFDTDYDDNGMQIHGPSYYQSEDEFTHGSYRSFTDNPGMPAFQTFSFSAITTLYGIRGDGTLAPIVAFTWGYNIEFEGVHLLPLTTHYYDQ